MHRGSTPGGPVWVTWLDGNAGGSGTTSSMYASVSASTRIRFLVNTVPVSPWIDGNTGRGGWNYTLSVDDNSFINWDCVLPYDGIFHLTFEMETPDTNIRPFPCFVHIRRGLATTSMTPVGIYEPDLSGNIASTGYGARSGIATPAYIDVNRRKFVGYPAPTTLSGWTGDTSANDLYAEMMSPWSPLFEPINMWWADPFHYDIPFVRGFPPKHGEAYFPNNGAGSGLRSGEGHETFPVKDGPRGVGWVSTYISGQFDSTGRFVFAETQGRIGYIYRDGEIKTIAGWVTDPRKDPVWWQKPLATVRQNQVLRGTWPANGIWPGELGGFHSPIDVAIHSTNENILYVAAYEDQVVWKVVINDLATNNVVVSVLAGLLQTRGNTDGAATDARFNGIISMVYDYANGNRLFVSDQDNSRVRIVSTVDGTTSTLWGASNTKIGPNIEFPYGPPSVISACPVGSIAGRGDWSDFRCAKANARVAVTSNPDVFLPHTIRMTSTGKIVLFDLGFGTIREMDITTGNSVVRARVNQKHNGGWNRGWAWMDVDRWGNSGGVDSIYWCKFVGEVFGDQHTLAGDPGCGPDAPTRSSGLPYNRNDGVSESMWKGINCLNNYNDCNRGCYSSSCSCTSGTYSATCPNQTLFSYGSVTCPPKKTSNMFSENFGFVPGGNTDEKSYMVFPTTQAATHYGLAWWVDPPHYPWLVAVDPGGATWFGGGGKHGLVRLRKRLPTDPDILDYADTYDKHQKYWGGQNAWVSGAFGAAGWPITSPTTPVASPHSVYGFDGHNLLGLNDTWAMAAFTDNQILDAFRVPLDIRNDPEAKSQVLWYLRKATGTNSNTPNPTVDWSSKSPPVWTSPALPVGCTTQTVVPTTATTRTSATTATTRTTATTATTATTVVNPPPAPTSDTSATSETSANTDSNPDSSSESQTQPTDTATTGAATPTPSDPGATATAPADTSADSAATDTATTDIPVGQTTAVVQGTTAGATTAATSQGGPTVITCTTGDTCPDGSNCPASLMCDLVGCLTNTDCPANYRCVSQTYCEADPAGNNNDSVNSATLAGLFSFSWNSISEKSLF